MTDTTQRNPASAGQTAMGVGILAIALALAAGAVSIPGGAGYGGVGPNFLPWLVAIVLAVCGAMIVYEARTGGFRNMGDGGGHARADWMPFAWVSAGLLANAALITTIGFILSCTLCYLLAVQGLRRANGESPMNARTLGIDAFTAVVISAPVFWAFTKFLAINLPGLTDTGWI